MKEIPLETDFRKADSFTDNCKIRMNIPEHEIRYSRYSTLDSFGRVFFWQNRVFRGINSNSLLFFRELQDKGILAELEKNELVPKTKVSDYKSDKYQIILEHEVIHPTTFVYEWGFDMVKAAGECILKINMILFRFGYETIDAHPYNILFKGCNPVFIDFGSFGKTDQKISWSAAEEFKGYFFYTLEIWNKVSHNMAKRIYSDDVTVFTKAEYQKILELGSSHHNFFERFTTRVLNKFKRRQVQSNNGRIEELTILQNELHKHKRNKISTIWGDYHDSYESNGEVISTERFNYIVNKIKELKITTITELAGNRGILSYLILQETDVKKIICTDYDEDAVNKMYDFFNQSRYSNQLSPVLLDFMRPIDLYNAGTPSDRLKSEAVLALAITHHLILTNNYGVDIILEKVSRYATKYVFIEFMPMGLWDGNVAPPTPEWYTQEWFASHFSKLFDLVQVEKVEENRILYIGTIK
jgi:hypothetical protein